MRSSSATTAARSPPLRAVPAPRRRPGRGRAACAPGAWVSTRTAAPGCLLASPRSDGSNITRSPMPPSRSITSRSATSRSATSSGGMFGLPHGGVQLLVGGGDPGPGAVHGQVAAARRHAVPQGGVVEEPGERSASASTSRTRSATTTVAPSTSCGSGGSAAVTSVGRPWANAESSAPLFVVAPAVKGNAATSAACRAAETSAAGRWSVIVTMSAAPQSAARPTSSSRKARLRGRAGRAR